VGPLKVGTTLSHKYRVERLLAESGGVILYEATDTSRAQRVWIKILQQDALSNAATLARFQREADGAKVLDVGKSEAGLPYMVATELGPDNSPRIPARAPPRGAKATLPGLAPPGAAVSFDDEPTPQSSDIPLLDDDAVVSDDGASADDAVVADEPTPAPEPKVIVSPLLARDPSPVLASPLIATPPPPLDDAEPTVPLSIPKAKPASNTPTIIIEDRQKKHSPTATWMVSLVVVASLTGVVGWYLGHQETGSGAPPPGQTAKAEPVTEDKPPPSTAATATTAATEGTATTETTATPATVTETTATPATTMAVTTETPATPATKATATGAPAAPAASAAAIAKPAPVHTAAPARTTPQPTTKKPAAAAQTAAGDPLTL